MIVQWVLSVLFPLRCPVGFYCISQIRKSAPSRPQWVLSHWAYLLLRKNISEDTELHQKYTRKALNDENQDILYIAVPFKAKILQRDTKMEKNLSWSYNLFHQGSSNFHNFFSCILRTFFCISSETLLNVVTPRIIRIPCFFVQGKIFGENWVVV
jgi:hypothetical protein